MMDTILKSIQLPITETNRQSLVIEMVNAARAGRKERVQEIANFLRANPPEPPPGYGLLRDGKGFSLTFRVTDDEVAAASNPPAFMDAKWQQWENALAKLDKCIAYQQAYVLNNPDSVV